jgi:hypothetical protein
MSDSLPLLSISIYCCFPLFPFFFLVFVFSSVVFRRGWPKASLGTAPEASFRRESTKRAFCRPFFCSPLCRGGELQPSDALRNEQLWIVVGNVALGLAPRTPCPVSIREPL